ncbi:hypothetical protein [Streptomyces sp. NBC_01298]
MDPQGSVAGAGASSPRRPLMIHAAGGRGQPPAGRGAAALLGPPGTPAGG